MNKVVVLFSFLYFLVSCNSSEKTLFVLMSDADTGINFVNDLPYSEEYNTYTYRNFYNGGGVALGDINNDGLVDIYFTGNITDNKLYLNKGNFKFEDITLKAGVSCPDVWSTGATMVDINHDGLLDIYVCKAGRPGGDNRHNELFINNGDLTFTEKSKEYNLDILSLSIHAVFFDYDLDGDLDCYILSNSLRSVGGFDLIENQREIPDPDGNKLLRNDNGKFLDVSQEAGIYTSKIGYGLGITLSDFNDDHYPDLFISNDFFEKDYLYINNQNGTFREMSEKAFMSMSMGSMGADAADLDNDLLPDIFVTEMLPRDHIRKKTKNIYENWDKYWSSVDKGYHHQYSRNSLHKNLGDTKFVDISRYSKVSDTDWSWASLAQDYDNDGILDLFVSNGIYKDLLDRDYLAYSANATMIKSKIDKKENVLKQLVDSMPTTPIKNCMFRGLGDLQYEWVSDTWGLGTPSFSNGSAYADLDNDGDLDLVVNNVNMQAFVYQNTLDNTQHNYLRVHLKSSDKNTFAIGAKVILKSANFQAMCEHFPSRGFQSSVQPGLHFGLGKVSKIDTLIIIWPDGTHQYELKVNTNQAIEFTKNNNSKDPKIRYPHNEFYNCSDIFVESPHQEISVNVFSKDRLAIEMNGFLGPSISSIDINNDYQEDVFIGGGKNQSSTLYVSEGNSYVKKTAFFKDEIKSEVTKSSFQDFNNDGFLDLYVAHGGGTFSEYHIELHDIIYWNDGNGNFDSKTILPFPSGINTTDVAFQDLDNNGFLDIIITEQYQNNVYGQKGNIHIILNKGNKNFSYYQPEKLKNSGYWTGIEFLDADINKRKRFVVVGKWSPITILSIAFIKDTLDIMTETLPMSSGLWNTVCVFDIDKDGQKDIIAGNEGLNTHYTIGSQISVADFDKNGSLDPIITYPKNKSFFPYHDIDELFTQIPSIKKKYTNYHQAASLQLDQLFDDTILKTAISSTIEELQTTAYINTGGSFTKKPLPYPIQFSSVYSILCADSENGINIFVGGNNFQTKPQFGRQDASYGWKLSAIKTNNILNFTHPKSIGVRGQIRSFALVQNTLLIGVNGNNIKQCILTN